MAEELVKEIANFALGLDTDSDPYSLPDGATPDCANVRFDRGGLVRRAGCAKYNATSLGAGAVRGIYPYYKADGTRKIMIAWGGNLYAGDKAGAVGTAIKTGLSSSADFAFTTWLDKCYITNGVDAVMQYDGTTVTDLTAAKRGKYIADYMERIFVANVGPDMQSFLWWSNLGDPATWDALNFLAVSTDDGDVITGLAVLPMGLLVFKNRSTFMVYGDDFDPATTNVQLRKLFPVGCVAPKSIAYYGSRVMWLAQDGVYSYDGASLAKLSANERGGGIDSLIRKSPRPQAAVGFVHQDKYWLCMTPQGGAENTEAYILDLKTGAWTRDVRAFSIGAGAVLNGRGDSGELLVGSESVGRLYWLETGATDDGANIQAYWKSKWDAMGMPGHAKMWRRLAVAQRTAGPALAVDYSVDYGAVTGTVNVQSAAGLGLWGDGGKWGDGGLWNAAIPARTLQSLPQGAIGRVLQLNVKMQDAAADSGVSSLTMFYRPKRVLKG